MIPSRSELEADGSMNGAIGKMTHWYWNEERCSALFDVCASVGFRWVCGNGFRCLRKAWFGADLGVLEKEGSWESVAFTGATRYHIPGTPLPWCSEVVLSSYAAVALLPPLGSFLPLPLFLPVFNIPASHQLQHNPICCSVLPCSWGCPPPGRETAISAYVPDKELPT